MSSRGLLLPVRSFFAHRTASRLSRHASLPRRALATTTVKRDEPVVPLRKQLKDQAKQKKLKAKAGVTEVVEEDASISDWELTVGIEIHAELNTSRKLFSEAPTSSPDVAPNTNIALFDLAYPGAQPHFQQATLLPALRAAIALGCDIARKSSFDRKHYFYQDQPAGYQITQYYRPFAREGSITLYDYDGIAPEDGKQITIGIKQIQMEQDTAKTVQSPPSEHFLDFNRVSHPLIEIITLPQIHHPSTAAALVRKIQGILKAVNACTTGMELGGLRADVNVSVKRKSAGDEYIGGSYHGVTGLGQRTEIKNLSSFKAVEDAIITERNRQIKVLEAGGQIEGETRGWTLGQTKTKKLRGKEGESDYRYMPDPDIAPVIVSSQLVEHLRSKLPLLPDQLLTQLTEDPEHGLTMKDAKTLLSFDEGDRVDFYFEVLANLKQRLIETPPQLGRIVGNWVIHELGALLAKNNLSWSESPVTADHLTSIIFLLQGGKLSNASAKQLLTLVSKDDDRATVLIASENNLLIQELPDQAYAAAARKFVEANGVTVKAITEKGQKGKIMWFVGQVMRAMAQEHGKGSVNAAKAKAAVLAAIGVEE